MLNIVTPGASVLKIFPIIDPKGNPPATAGKQHDNKAHKPYKDSTF